GGGGRPRGGLTDTVGEQDPPLSGVGHPLQPPAYEQLHPVGGIRRVGEDHVGGTTQRRRQPQTQIRGVGTYLHPELLGGLVDVGEYPLVDVHNRHTSTGGDQGQRHRRQVVVTHAQHGAVGQFETGGKKQCTPQRGVGGRGDMIQIQVGGGPTTHHTGQLQ